MSLKILADECLQAKSLVRLLRETGHDVLPVNEANLTGQPDDVIFASAISENRLVLTSNCADFVELHNECVESKKTHPGILLVYLNNDPNRDMNNQQIVKAIANLEASEIPLATTIHSLVAYNY